MRGGKLLGSKILGGRKVASHRGVTVLAAWFLFHEPLLPATLQIPKEPDDLLSRALCLH